MRLGLVVVAALFAGAFAAHFLMEDRGYVLLRFRGYSLETSIPVLLLALIFGYLLLRLAMRLLRVPRNIGAAAGAYRRKRAHDSLARGLMELNAGHWSQGERLLARDAHNSETPLLHYLGAARAAQRQGDTRRRDAWLELARTRDPGARPAVLLARAGMQIEAESFREALATLRQLEEAEPLDAHGLALQVQALEALGEWAQIRALLPGLRRRGRLGDAELERVERRAWQELLVSAGGDGNPEAVQALWRGCPRRVRSDPDVFRRYVEALGRSGDAAAAGEILRKALRRSWDPGLVLLYGALEAETPEAQLKHAEGWLKDHPEDPALLLTVARLAMRCELWGKARSYLESSLAIEPRGEAYLLYGRLLEQMGESRAATGAFRSGLALATGTADDRLKRLSAPEPISPDRPRNQPRDPETTGAADH